MAIKVTGNVIIDNNRNLVNVSSATFTSNGYIKVPSGNTSQRTASPEVGMLRYNTDEGAFEGYDGSWSKVNPALELIVTPTNVDPANAATGVSNTNPILEGSPYYHVYGKEKSNGQWQISNTSNFSTTVVDAVVSGNSVTYTTSVTLPNGTHYWRVRYQDSDGVWSNYSTATQFENDAPIPPPTTLGQSYQGGFYTGVINIGGGVCYYLVVAPNSVGCACCRWKCDGSGTPGTDSRCNGYTNTYGPMTNATHPAGNWTATRTIGGYSDWYLPAIDELNTMYTNQSTMPSGEGYAPNNYWSSTQYSAGIGINRIFDLNGEFLNSVQSTFRTRAVRRVPV
jgi:hypothetical protein